MILEERISKSNKILKKKSDQFDYDFNEVKQNEEIASNEYEELKTK